MLSFFLLIGKTIFYVWEISLRANILLAFSLSLLFLFWIWLMEHFDYRLLLTSSLLSLKVFLNFWNPEGHELFRAQCQSCRKVKPRCHLQWHLPWLCRAKLAGWKAMQGGGIYFGSQCEGVVLMVGTGGSGSVRSLSIHVRKQRKMNAECWCWFFFFSFYGGFQLRKMPHTLAPHLGRFFHLI